MTKPRLNSKAADRKCDFCLTRGVIVVGILALVLYVLTRFPQSCTSLTKSLGP